MAFAISICNSKLQPAVEVSCGSTSGIASCSIRRPPSRPALQLGRRPLLALFFSTATASPVAAEDDDSRSLLLQKYLKKSQQNKIKNDKERLDSYYKRNYKDYFELFEGSLESLQGKDQLSDAEKGILDWLQKNK